jgi:hypothetical protein
MTSSPAFKILRLFGPEDQPLSQTHYLAEYEAIIVKPEWRYLVVSGPTTGDVARSEQALDRKSTELLDFLSAGGLLVVLLTPFEERILMSGPVQRQDDNYGWWSRQAGPMAISQLMTLPGSGTSAMPTGSGSEFDSYVDSIQSYEARLGSWFDNNDNVQILAHNRAGGAIAAEITVGSGTIVCVPPPVVSQGEELLLKAVEVFLSHRFGPGLKWPLPEEEELARTRQKVLGDFHTSMAEVTAKQRAVQELKRAVFGKSQVRRGVRYYEQATRPGSTPKQTMTALYDLIEMLRDYFDEDWDGMADTLGVSHNSVDRIKRLANKKELHLRHTTADDPEGVDQAELDKAVADGKAILSAFIAHEYTEEAVRIPPSS